MYAVGHLSEDWIKQLSGQCNRYTHRANSLFLTKDIQYTWFRPMGVCRFCSNIHLLGLCVSFVGLFFVCVFLSLSLFLVQNMAALRQSLLFLVVRDRRGRSVWVRGCWEAQSEVWEGGM